MAEPEEDESTFDFDEHYGDYPYDDESDLDGDDDVEKAIRLGIVNCSPNHSIVKRLMTTAYKAANDLAIADVQTITVPTSLELPLGARWLAESGTVDGIVCVTCLIREELLGNYDILTAISSNGVQSVGIGTGIPTIWGVMTVPSQKTAVLESQVGGSATISYNAVNTAVQMVRLKRKISAMSEP